MALELELKGKVAIISGGSDGMGRAAAERLASEGVKVGICARRKDHLERAAEEIRKATGGEVLAVPADVSRAADVEAVVKAVAGRWGGVDILLNNAGTSNANAFEAVDDATWQADFDLKVMGAVRFCRLAIPHMKRRGGGQIVNVTVVGGKAPTARALPTTLSRAAGINLTKSLANEYAADGIRVNTICIGLIRSAQIDRRAKDGDLEAHYAGLAKRVPLGRVAHAREFADLVAFLVSERASYITGTAINFDGGRSAVVLSKGASTAPSEPPQKRVAPAQPALERRLLRHAPQQRAVTPAIAQRIFAISTTTSLSRSPGIWRTVSRMRSPG
jgi:3-oxoacyl-[acyl-carrier protein] reductase